MRECACFRIILQRIKENLGKASSRECACFRIILQRIKEYRERQVHANENGFASVGYNLEKSTGIPLRYANAHAFGMPILIRKSALLSV